MPDLKRELQSLMERHQGRQASITRREIRQVLQIGLSQDRQLRIAIRESRLDGFPILFATEKPAGYYLPETLAELRTGINAMRSYVIDECRTIRAYRLKGSQYLAGESQGKLL